MTDLTRLQEALYKADVETIVRDLKYLQKADEVAARLAQQDEALRVILRDYEMTHGTGDLEMQPALYQAHQALAQPAEAVAVVDWNGGSRIRTVILALRDDLSEGTTLYTAPQPPAIPEPSDEDAESALRAWLNCPSDTTIGSMRAALTTDRSRLRANEISSKSVEPTAAHWRRAIRDITCGPDEYVSENDALDAIEQLARELAQEESHDR